MQKEIRNVLVVVSVLVLFVGFVSAFNLKDAFNQVTGNVVNQAKCMDSDGGINFEEPGYVALKGGAVYLDKCLGSYVLSELDDGGMVKVYSKIKEFYCDNGKLKSVVKTRNGTDDGFCVRLGSTVNDKKVVEGAWVPSDYASPVCNDSNPNHSPLVGGIVSNENLTKKSVCLAGNYLKQFKCTSDGKIAAVFYKSSSSVDFDSVVVDSAKFCAGSVAIGCIAGPPGCMAGIIIGRAHAIHEFVDFIEDDKEEYTNKVSCGKLASCVNDVNGAAYCKPNRIINEVITCKFKGSKEVQTCNATDSSGLYDSYCSGKSSCILRLSGALGNVFSWDSTCRGDAFTAISGKKKVITFDCKN